MHIRRLIGSRVDVMDLCNIISVTQSIPQNGIFQPLYGMYPAWTIVCGCLNVHKTTHKNKLTTKISLFTVVNKVFFEQLL